MSPLDFKKNQGTKIEKRTNRVVRVEEKELWASCCGIRSGARIGRRPAPSEPQHAGTGETPGLGSQ